IARERIAATVELSWLDERPLSATIYYFPVAPMEGDIDNIVKPILDAMVGVAYSNDRVIERVLAQKFEPDVGWSFRQPSEILARTLEAGAPVVYICLDDDLAWRQS
ncbi:MAG: RusA family crossover junction endodeoxyribonuclease, partial [Mesorhizobium sp.]|nr:RusA family crossover junction endodeoxyribonuclease [Mesorhizobium sp.]